MCIPCAEKKRLNEQSQAIVDQGEGLRKRVEKMWKRGEIDDAGAEAVLQPLMDADRAYAAHGKLAIEKATRAYTAAVELAAD